MYLSVLYCIIIYGVKKQLKMIYKSDLFCRYLVLVRNIVFIFVILRGSDADFCIQVFLNFFVIIGSLDLYGIKVLIKVFREED